MYEGLAQQLNIPLQNDNQPSTLRKYQESPLINLEDHSEILIDKIGSSDAVQSEARLDPNKLNTRISSLNKRTYLKYIREQLDDIRERAEKSSKNPNIPNHQRELKRNLSYGTNSYN